MTEFKPAQIKVIELLQHMKQISEELKENKSKNLLDTRNPALGGLVYHKYLELKDALAIQIARDLINDHKLFKDGKIS